MKYFKLKLDGGFGSVFQQIIGAVGLAKYYNIQYIINYSDIRISGHGDNYNIENTLNQFVDLDTFSSNVDTSILKVGEKSEDFNLDILKEDTLYTFNAVHRYIQHKKILHVYTLAASLIKPFLKTVSTNYSTDYYNIAIHIRRGDITLRERYFSRIVDITFYENFIKLFQEQYTGTKPCKFHIYTQPNSLNLNELDAISQISNVVINLDTEDQCNIISTIIDWYHFTIADVLITSKSSYSYSAAFFNPNKIYYIPFWHPPCEGWVNCLEFCNTIL